MSYRVKRSWIGAFTYQHIPKTGGTSIVGWLKTCKAGRKISAEGGHAAWLLLPDQYHDSVITTVRNPYDRLVSYYFHVGSMVSAKRDVSPLMKKQYDEWNKGFKNYVFNCKYHPWRKNELNTPAQGGDRAHWIADPQVKYLPNKLDGIIILRFENLSADFEILQEIMNNHTPLPRRNTTESKGFDKQHWTHYYDDETREEVYRWWQKDFELLGYEP